MPVVLPEFLGLDTNPFIYFIEDEGGPRADFLARFVFRPMAAGELRAVTSVVTLSELLVPAVKSRDAGAAMELEAAFFAIPGLDVGTIDQDVARLAAELRARTGFTLLDAYQVATAMSAGAGGFLTNDRRLVRDDAGIPILWLDGLVSDSA